MSLDTCLLPIPSSPLLALFVPRPFWLHPPICTWVFRVVVCLVLHLLSLFLVVCLYQFGQNDQPILIFFPTFRSGCLGDMLHLWFPHLCLRLHLFSSSYTERRIFLKMLFSKTSTLLSLCIVSVHASLPYKTVGFITILYIRSLVHLIIILFITDDNAWCRLSVCQFIFPHSQMSQSTWTYSPFLHSVTQVAPVLVCNCQIYWAS